MKKIKKREKIRCKHKWGRFGKDNVLFCDKCGEYIKKGKKGEYNLYA